MFIMYREVKLTDQVARKVVPDGVPVHYLIHPISNAVVEIDHVFNPESTYPEMVTWFMNSFVRKVAGVAFLTKDESRALYIGLTDPKSGYKRVNSVLGITPLVPFNVWAENYRKENGS